MLKFRDNVLKAIYKEATIFLADIKIEGHTDVEISKQVHYMIANGIVKTDKGNKLYVSKTGMQEYARIHSGRVIRRTMVSKQNVMDLFAEDLAPITITELNALFMGNTFISPSIYKTRKWVKELYAENILYMHHKKGNVEYFVCAKSKHLTPDIIKKSIELQEALGEGIYSIRNIRYFFSVTTERCKAYEC